MKYNVNFDVYTRDSRGELAASVTSISFDTDDVEVMNRISEYIITQQRASLSARDRRSPVPDYDNKVEMLPAHEIEHKEPDTVEYKDPANLPPFRNIPPSRPEGDIDPAELDSPEDDQFQAKWS